MEERRRTKFLKALKYAIEVLTELPSSPWTKLWATAAVGSAAAMIEPHVYPIDEVYWNTNMDEDIRFDQFCVSEDDATAAAAWITFVNVRDELRGPGGIEEQMKTALLEIQPNYGPMLQGIWVDKREILARDGLSMAGTDGPFYVNEDQMLHDQRINLIEALWDFHGDGGNMFIEAYGVWHSSLPGDIIGTVCATFGHPGNNNQRSKERLMSLLVEWLFGLAEADSITRRGIDANDIRDQCSDARLQIYLEVAIDCFSPPFTGSAREIEAVVEILSWASHLIKAREKNGKVVDEWDEWMGGEIAACSEVVQCGCMGMVWAVEKKLDGLVEEIRDRRERRKRAVKMKLTQNLAAGM